eukprot:Lankesteria_metandrocarpae@DN909_c0_g1_i1.p1
MKIKQKLIALFLFSKRRTPLFRHITGRLFVLCASFLLSLFCGSVYGFGLISVPVKIHCDFSTKEMDFIYSTGAAGAYVTILPSLIFDFYGPNATIVYGGVLGCFGYSMFASHLRDATTHSSAAVALYFMLATQGSAALYLTMLFTNMSRFAPSFKGRVVGFLASAYGLSAAFLGVISIIAAVLLSLPASLSVTTIVPVPATFQEKDDIAIKVTTDTTMITSGKSPKKYQPMAVKSNEKGAMGFYDTSRGAHYQTRSTLLSANVLHTDFVYYTTFACVIQGVCAMVIGNASLFCDSLGLSTAFSIRAVKCISIANCCGRLLFGCLIDALRHLFVIPFVFVISSCIFVVSQTLMLIETLRAPGADFVIFSLSCVGLVSGTNAAAGPSYLSERFGPGRLATLYAISTSCIAAAATVLGAVTGAYYDSEVRRQNHLKHNAVLLRDGPVKVIDQRRRLSAIDVPNARLTPVSRSLSEVDKSVPEKVPVVANNTNPEVIEKLEGTEDTEWLAHLPFLPPVNNLDDAGNNNGLVDDGAGNGDRFGGGAGKQLSNEDGVAGGGGNFMAAPVELEVQPVDVMIHHKEGSPVLPLGLHHHHKPRHEMCKGTLCFSHSATLGIVLGAFGFWLAHALMHREMRRQKRHEAARV